MPWSREAPREAPDQGSARARLCPPGSSSHVGPSWPSSGWRGHRSASPAIRGPPLPSPQQTHTHSHPTSSASRRACASTPPRQGSPEAAPLRRDSETTPPHPSPHQHLPWIMAPAAPLAPCTCPIFLWDSPRCDRETAARGGDLTVSESLRRETRGGMDVQSPALLEPPRHLLSCDVSVIR